MAVKKEKVPASAKQVQGEIDPFASLAEPKLVGKPRTKKVDAAKAKASSSAEKAAPKKAGSAVKDPFVDPAVTITAEQAATKAPSRRKSTAAKPARAIAAERLPKAKAVGTRSPKHTAAPTGAEVSPAFKALSEVELPALQREDRARLQMQGPTRLYFYWSVGKDPWSRARTVFGPDLGNYTLVLKLIDQKRGYEQLSHCAAEGNWWFDVEPDGIYQAEVGFYAPGRPYFRILHSNVVHTPRRSPSPRPAAEADWRVNANKFAEVLDVSGFSRDSFDVAVAGDDVMRADDASYRALSSFLGEQAPDVTGLASDEIRYALFSLASGVSLQDLEGRVSPALFALLRANMGAIDSERAMASLSEQFDIDETELVEEEFGPAVFGASLVNFPRGFKKSSREARRSTVPSGRFQPLSSHSLAR